MTGRPAVEPGGRLGIVLEHADGHIRRVRITSTRPAQAARVLVGHTPTEAARLVPLLYSLCGSAQRIAVLQACEEAQQLKPGQARREARAFVLALESVREHCLRLLVDWPAALGLAPDHDTAAKLFALQRIVATGSAGDHAADQAARRLRKLVQETVLGPDWSGLAGADLAAFPAPGAMLPRLLGALRANGWERLGAGADTPPLEELPRAFWHERLSGEPCTFALQPDIDGTPRETSPYARRCGAPEVREATRRWGNGLATRLLALAGELNSLLPKLQGYLTRTDEAPLSDLLDDDAAQGDGIGVVEAARGTLTHRVILAQGRIRDYALVAPTEWNFHPQGVAARSLAGLAFESEAQCAAQARALICAIDPCVAYDLDIRRHA